MPLCEGNSRLFRVRIRKNGFWVCCCFLSEATRRISSPQACGQAARGQARSGGRLPSRRRRVPLRLLHRLRHRLHAPHPVLPAVPRPVRARVMADAKDRLETMPGSTECRCGLTFLLKAPTGLRRPVSPSLFLCVLLPKGDILGVCSFVSGLTVFDPPHPNSLPRPPRPFLSLHRSSEPPSPPPVAIVHLVSVPLCDLVSAPQRTAAPTCSANSSVDRPSGFPTGGGGRFPGGARSPRGNASPPIAAQSLQRLPIARAHGCTDSDES